jgi:predicted nucleic acid-binding protein
LIDIDWVFLETSAFLKLYLPEKGATWLRGFVIDKQIVISDICFMETAVALGRLYRQNQFTRREAAKQFAVVHEDRSKYKIIPFNTVRQQAKIRSYAFNLPVTARLRTLDAIHLAAATTIVRELNAQTPAPKFTFISSDKQLLSVAQGIGFFTENPEDHP